MNIKPLTLTPKMEGDIMEVSTKVALQIIKNNVESNDYDLSKYLPRGFIPKMMEKTGRKKSLINACLATLRKQADIRIKQTKLTLVVPTRKVSYIHTGVTKIVEQYLKDHNYNLTKRLKFGEKDKIAHALGIESKKVRNAIQIIKHKNGIRVQKSKSIKKPSVNNLVQKFKGFDIIRRSPNQNRISSDNILKALMNDIPKGGAGMMIGTPTPFAISTNPKNDLLLTDELEIAIALRLTCGVVPSIVVGNLVSPDKAKVKGLFWKNINSTNNSDITVGRVDRDSYTYHVTKMAEEHSLAKVVLITSGVWSCSKPTQMKYGHDFNFKSPSMFLSGIYPNLHILAMVMHGNLFKVHYVHNGKETIIE